MIRTHLSRTLLKPIIKFYSRKLMECYTVVIRYDYFCLLWSVLLKPESISTTIAC